jgi:hypothetical protein
MKCVHNFVGENLYKATSSESNKNVKGTCVKMIVVG